MLTSRGGFTLALYSAPTLGGEPGAPIDEAVEYDRLYQVNFDAAGNVTTVLLRYGRDTPAGSSGMR